METVFNVINYNPNRDKMEYYDVMPYFRRCYENHTPKRTRPKTFEEFKGFILAKSMYMYWARCEYEIILKDWPNFGISEKWDVHKQVEMNIDVITELLMKEYVKRPRKNKTQV